MSNFKKNKKANVELIGIAICTGCENNNPGSKGKIKGYPKS